MKGISVRIRKVTLHNDNGYAFTRWMHPTQEPTNYSDHFVHKDDIVHGVVVSEPFALEDNTCVVVQLQTDGRFDSYETFWIGHLG